MRIEAGKSAGKEQPGKYDKAKAAGTPMASTPKAYNADADVTKSEKKKKKKVESEEEPESEEEQPKKVRQRPVGRRSPCEKEEDGLSMPITHALARFLLPRLLVSSHPLSPHLLPPRRRRRRRMARSRPRRRTRARRR